MTKLVLNTIQNIIFDLGRVIIDIDEKASADAFQQLGVKDRDRLYNGKEQDVLFADFETGKIDPDRFFDYLKDQLIQPVSHQEIAKAWDQMLIGIPVERKTLLEQLSRKFRLFLLSNTNEYHMRSIFRMENRRYGEEKLFPFFEQEYYSYRLGLRKPDPAIFRLILEEQAIQRSETLFVDDNQGHIQAAAALGLHTLLLPGNKTILDFF